MGLVDSSLLVLVVMLTRLWVGGWVVASLELVAGFCRSFVGASWVVRGSFSLVERRNKKMIVFPQTPCSNFTANTLRRQRYSLEGLFDIANMALIERLSSLSVTPSLGVAIMVVWCASKKDPQSFVKACKRLACLSAERLP